MPPIIHFVRHAQAYHNLTINNYSMHDPDLTELGKQQCFDLQRAFPHHDRVTHVVASPIKRALWTALLGFSSTFATRGIRLTALPELQENTDLPCDTGSDKEVLEREFANQPIDLSLVQEGWNDKKGPWAPQSDAISERCKAARVWLRELAGENDQVVVVTHGSLLHTLTEDWSDFDKHTGTGWANTEFRSYTFVPHSNDNASLIETEESLKRRRATRLTKEDQLQLKAKAEREWAAAGWQLPGKIVA
ncbi:Phosphoglycerate mutase family protein [Lasiodiplodia theobromae]|uniref:Phosphoglycerate mutase family protein n=1 Tax=Lasiodiplodia theobromae TaxID=45133 RepID=UPI0015C34719|nr:Phosphoglycerate mutase family protein [Lasiodiplodia theobromae]KAF4534015.1 Phosphoglycerate mutase family protein [Lasiodiplodia theobromae]